MLVTRCTECNHAELSVNPDCQCECHVVAAPDPRDAELATLRAELATANARIADLRLALREVIAIVGGLAAPEVSDAFLTTGAPAEAKAVLAQRDARIAALEAERDAAVADAARLDWLENLGCFEVEDQGPWDGHEFFLVDHQDDGDDGFETLRECIDAARAGKAGG